MGTRFENPFNCELLCLNTREQRVRSARICAARLKVLVQHRVNDSCILRRNVADDVSDGPGSRIKERLNVGVVAGG